MAIIEALREDYGRTARQAEFTLPLGRHIEVNGLRLAVVLTAYAPPEALAKRGKLLTSDLSLVRLIDADLGAEIGAVALHRYLKNKPLTLEYVINLTGQLNSLLSKSGIVAGSLMMAHALLGMGYRAETSPLSYGMYPLDRSKYFLYFTSTIRYAYGDLISIDVSGFSVHVSRRGKDLVNWAELQVTARGVVDDAVKGLRDIVTEALRPWRTRAKVTTDARRYSGSSRGNTIKFRATVISPCKCLPLVDYLGRYVPEVARRVKEYVSAEAERQAWVNPA